MKKIIFIFFVLVFLALPKIAFGDGIIDGIVDFLFGKFNFSCGQIEPIGPHFAIISCKGEIDLIRVIYECGLGRAFYGLRIYNSPRELSFRGPRDIVVSDKGGKIWIDCKHERQPGVRRTEVECSSGGISLGPFQPPGLWHTRGSYCMVVLCDTCADLFCTITTGEITEKLLPLGACASPSFTIGESTPPLTCGNGVIDPPDEDCEPPITLGGKTCRDFGREGILGCYQNCRFDTSACYFRGIVPPTLFICPGDYCPPGSICLPNPLCGKKWLEEVVESTIVDVIFYLGLVLLPLIIIIGAFFWIIAAGNAKKVQQGQNLIKYGLIGFFFILLAKAIIGIIKRILIK